MGRTRWHLPIADTKDYTASMPERLLIKLKTWPNSIEQEHLEALGFFNQKGWRMFCDPDELATLVEWLKDRHLSFSVHQSNRAGKYEDYSRLSEQLLRTDGGSPTACALCGRDGIACYQWIEGDDADHIEATARRFYLCGLCVREKILPHGRLYTRADDVL